MLRLQEQELGCDKIAHVLVYRPIHTYYAFSEEPRVDVKGPLSTRCGLDHHGHKAGKTCMLMAACTQEAPCPSCTPQNIHGRPFSATAFDCWSNVGWLLLTSHAARGPCVMTLHMQWGLRTAAPAHGAAAARQHECVAASSWHRKPYNTTVCCFSHPAIEELAAAQPINPPMLQEQLLAEFEHAPALHTWHSRPELLQGYVTVQSAGSSGFCSLNTQHVQV